MPGLRRSKDESMSAMGIPLVNVHHFDPDALQGPPPPYEQLHNQEEEEESDVLGTLAAPSSDDISSAALALSRSMAANTTRWHQELQEGTQRAGLFALPPPPPPPPTSASWFTVLIYNITHSNLYRIITQPSTVIVDLTTRHLQSLQEYSERQRFLSSSGGSSGSVLSIFSKSSSSGASESLKKRKSMYQLTEEEDRLTHNPESELSKAVELQPVSMDSIGSARPLSVEDDDQGMDSAASESDYGDDDAAVGSGRRAILEATHGFASVDRSGRSNSNGDGSTLQGTRRRRRRTGKGGQALGQGTTAYLNPFIDQSWTRRNHHHASDDPTYRSSDDDDAYDDALEWEGDDIASDYEARTNSVRLTEKGFQKPIPTFALSGGGGTPSLAKGMNPYYNDNEDDVQWSSSPPPDPSSNSYSLHSQPHNARLPRPLSSMTFYNDDAPVLARLPKSRARTTETGFSQSTAVEPSLQQESEHQHQQHKLDQQHEEDDHELPVVHDHLPPSQRGNAASTTNSRYGWQRLESESSWTTMPCAVPLPSEEDTHASVQIHSSSATPPSAEYIRTTATMSAHELTLPSPSPPSSLQHNRRRSSTERSSSNESVSHRHYYHCNDHQQDPYIPHTSEWQYDDGQTMEEDSDGRYAVAPQIARRHSGSSVSNKSNNGDRVIGSKVEEQRGENEVATGIDSSDIPAQIVSTWQRLNTTNGFEASPPTLSAMAGRDLEDDDENEPTDALNGGTDTEMGSTASGSEEDMTVHHHHHSSHHQGFSTAIPSDEIDSASDGASSR